MLTAGAHRVLMRQIVSWITIFYYRFTIFSQTYIHRASWRTTSSHGKLNPATVHGITIYIDLPAIKLLFRVNFSLPRAALTENVAQFVGLSTVTTTMIKFNLEDSSKV